MEAQITLTLKVAAAMLKVKPHRIIHLCETNCVKPSQDCDGRGTAREFSRDDLFLLGVSLMLLDAGITTDKIAIANELFKGIVRHRALRTQFQAGGLYAVISALGTTEDPAMLHLKMPEPGVPSSEPACVYLESSKIPETVTLPGNSRSGFIRSSQAVNRWPIRVSINLTYVLKTIRLW